MRHENLDTCSGISGTNRSISALSTTKPPSWLQLLWQTIRHQYMLQEFPNPGVRMRSLLLAVLVLPVADSRVPAQGPAKAPLQLTEWTVPWEKTRPRDPFLDAQGRVWFVGQEGNYVASLDPAAGTRRQRLAIAT